MTVWVRVPLMVQKVVSENLKQKKYNLTRRQQSSLSKSSFVVKGLFSSYFYFFKLRDEFLDTFKDLLEETKPFL